MINALPEDSRWEGYSLGSVGIPPTTSCGSTGMKSPASSCWPAIGTAERRVGAWASDTVRAGKAQGASRLERRRDRLRRGEVPRTRCRCRPDRDRRWACLAYEVPGPIDLPIFLDRGTADAIERHALRDTSVELGGILLGKECLDEETSLPFVLVTQSLEAKHYENTQASFTYTHDSWEEITRDRDRLHPDLDIVGWYHTHPDFGIFLSSHDLFIHRNFFAQPLQVAYVVDPVRQTRGFFQWRDGGLEEVGGYYVFTDRGDRIALARLINDLENFPNTEGGGGFSPRLEAELIAMLTRPTQSYQSSVADRTQTAALFSLIGGIAGMIGLAGVLWLNALSNRVNEQTETLKEIERSTAEASARQNIALDRLLGEPGGESPEKFVTRYNQVTEERDKAIRDVEAMKTVRLALSDRARFFESEANSLKKDLEKATQIVNRYKEEKGDYPDIRSRILDLIEDSNKKATTIKHLDELLDNSQGRKAALLLRKYNWAWYLAIAGWGAVTAPRLGRCRFARSAQGPSRTRAGTDAGGGGADASDHLSLFRAASSGETPRDRTGKHRLSQCPLIQYFKRHDDLNLRSPSRHRGCPHAFAARVCTRAGRLPRRSRRILN